MREGREKGEGMRDGGGERGERQKRGERCEVRIGNCEGAYDKSMEVCV